MNLLVEEIDEINTKITGFKDETGQYQCSKCEKQLSNYQNFIRHNRSVHEGIKYPCNKCNQTFTQEVKLRIHIESIHVGLRFPCHLCDYVATQKNNLYRHKKTKHNYC